jgi:Amino acid permease
MGRGRSNDQRYYRCGYFRSASKIYALTNTHSVLAFVACAVIVALIALCSAEIASRFIHTGGPYLYAREAFGSLIGFAVGWLSWLARVSALALICNVLVAYLSFFWKPAGMGVWRAVIITSLVVVLAIINIIGVSRAANVKLLTELYELRSVAEHLNPLDDKLQHHPDHERDSIKVLRIFQSKLLASFVYRKILGTPTLLANFETEAAIDSMWQQPLPQLVNLWGGTINLRTAPNGLFFDYLNWKVNGWSWPMLLVIWMRMCLRTEIKADHFRTESRFWPFNLATFRC